MKRFYKLVSISQELDGYSIKLDDRPVKTPAKGMLIIPNEALANAVMVEWAAQEEQIIPDSMPLTQLISTKLDRISLERGVMSDTILNYLDTDLVCYLASSPPGAVKAQDAAWSPMRTWFNDRFAADLKTTDGLSAITQDQDTHTRVREFVEGLNDDHFTIAQLTTSLSGSLILALAFIERAITAKQLMNATFVDELFKADIYNEELHGGDPAQIKAQKAFKKDIDAAQIYLDSLKNNNN